MASELPIVRCEMCDALHRPSTVTCDACLHVLGAAPDPARVATEKATLKKQIAGGSFALVVLFAANPIVFLGASPFVLEKPILWLSRAVHRLRGLSVFEKRRA